MPLHVRLQPESERYIFNFISSNPFSEIEPIGAYEKLKILESTEQGKKKPFISLS